MLHHVVAQGQVGQTSDGIRASGADESCAGGCPPLDPKRTSPKAQNQLGANRIAFASVLVVLRLCCTAPVCDITHIVEYKDREGRHAMPLFLAKRIVEWLPRLGELIQIG